MNFLEKIEPFLESEDIHINEFVFHALVDFPNVPEEWTVRLLRKILSFDESRLSFLADMSKHTCNEEALQVLIEGAKSASKEKLHFWVDLMIGIEPELAVKYQQELTPFLPSDMWAFYEIILHGGEHEVWTEYGALLVDLNQDPHHVLLQKKAKLTAKTLLQKDWISANEIAFSLNENLNEDYFGYDGVFTVYQIGLRGSKEYIPLLASLLVREDDVLLEEVASTLTQFQSDEVIEAVVPYLKNPESIVYAASILGSIKSDLAIQELIKAYHATEDGDDQAILVEALAMQLTNEAVPEIEAYLETGNESNLIEIDQLAYGFYMIMGLNHLELKNWKLSADIMEKEFLQHLNSKPLAERDKIPQIPIIKKVEIGRNDPCPCGSGKKFKKCCQA